MKRIPARYVLKNTARQWVVSSVVFLVWFAFFMWCHKVRGRDYSWFTTEKCVAIAATFCIGLALAIGPLSRFFRGMEGALPYRRSLGLVGAWAVVVHVLMCMIYLPLAFPEEYSKDFPLSYYVYRWPITLMDFAALGLLMVIALTSYRRGMKWLGARKWMILQKSSYLVLALTAAHLLLLGKIPGWITWFRTFDKPLPPGALTTTTFCLLVLLLKVLDVAVHGDTLSGQGTPEPADEASPGQ
ncbi:MAG: ferric reductase-like transmembrane domain-containing protein [Planctomycetes bacterium]|nr:ferric reductase-like transmembrane domain-containing protein [Planctomycetota bacterium]